MYTVATGRVRGGDAGGSTIISSRWLHKLVTSVIGLRILFCFCETVMEHKSFVCLCVLIGG